ncbi:MAG: biopolymer transporter ExbD [Planctomycetota bacterium]|nr:biopolymer transporter ExbD [Planctomycetota bacterium]
MRLVKKKDVDLDLGLNMTPMIDIVFQLLIFFMVVTELATLDLERLNLPYAEKTDTSKERTKSGTTLITVNVTRETDVKKSLIRIKKQTYTQTMLEELMKFEASVGDMVPNEFDPNKKISELEVLIRADRDATYEGVQRVFDACQKATIWKISVASTEEKYTREVE